MHVLSRQVFKYHTKGLSQSSGLHAQHTRMLLQIYVNKAKYTNCYTLLKDLGLAALPACILHSNPDLIDK